MSVFYDKHPMEISHLYLFFLIKSRNPKTKTRCVSIQIT